MLTARMRAGRWHGSLFTLLMTLVSRGLMARDFLLGVTRGLRTPNDAERFFFASGDRSLEGSLVVVGVDVPVLLICHGIGETIEHWGAVQTYFAENGIGSMVFDYSGYGASSGRISAKHCDGDLASAYVELKRRIGSDVSVFLLGFSLGSGIAAKGAALLSPPVAGLFLCRAYTSFHEAARSAGLMKWIMFLVPELWNTVELVRKIRVPVCVVHSDADRLFPVEMAERIAQACGPNGELVIVPGFVHNEPYLRPAHVYWGPLVQRVGGTAITARSINAESDDDALSSSA